METNKNYQRKLNDRAETNMRQKKHDA